MITVGVGIFAIILGSIFAAALGKGISKPVVDLTKAADEISMGKIDTSINVKTNDEINELAQAIERMRMSLKKAMERLTKMREQ
jgi:HAMP domain-containing protein